MTEEEINNPRASADEAVLQQQYLRAMSSFEGIILGQMDVKEKLSDRLNYSIRAGLLILSLVAISILTLLLMLSTQINRITDVVADMNEHFIAVSAKMHDIRGNVVAMESQVALMSDIELYTTVMSQEMDTITLNMDSMQHSVGEIEDQFTAMRDMMYDISVTIHQMNAEVQMINREMYRMSEPVETLNRFLPIP